MLKLDNVSQMDLAFTDMKGQLMLSVQDRFNYIH
jgi:hypothetical protein